MRDRRRLLNTLVEKGNFEIFNKSDSSYGISINKINYLNEDILNFVQITFKITIIIICHSTTPIIWFQIRKFYVLRVSEQHCPEKIVSQIDLTGNRTQNLIIQRPQFVVAPPRSSRKRLIFYNNYPKG